MPVIGWLGWCVCYSVAVGLIQGIVVTIFILLCLFGWWMGSAPTCENAGCYRRIWPWRRKTFLSPNSLEYHLCGGDCVRGMEQAMFPHPEVKITWTYMVVPQSFTSIRS